MTKLNKYQMVGFLYFQGLPKESHLSTMFLKHPLKANGVMTKLLSRNWAKTLENHLSQYATKEFDTDDDYTWDIVSESRRNIPIVEALTIDGTPVDENMIVGENTTPFYVVFAEDWWGDGEQIVGEKNEVYPLRILGDVTNYGTNYRYKVELMNGSSQGMPGSELQKGKRFSVDYAPVEKELSRKVGTLRFSSNISMRNEFSRVRMQFKVPGTMLGDKLAVGFPVVDSKTNKVAVANTWMTVVEWEFEKQWAEYKNNLIMYSRSNRNFNGEYMNFGKSGNVIKVGDGLRAQMEVSNTYYYTTFSLKLLESILFDIGGTKLDFKDRLFTIHTGEHGAYLFHKAVNQDVSGWSKIEIDGSTVGAVQKANSPIHSNALKAVGYQFTEYYAPNGYRVKLEVDPFYDDPVRNKIMHPDGGVAESYRFDIFYMGEQDNPNIVKCVPKNQPERRGYQWGPFANPFTGSANNNFASYDEDSAVEHVMATLGVLVYDPTKCVSLIPAILG